MHSHISRCYKSILLIVISLNLWSKILSLVKKICVSINKLYSWKWICCQSWGITCSCYFDSNRSYFSMCKSSRRNFFMCEFQPILMIGIRITTDLFRILSFGKQFYFMNVQIIYQSQFYVYYKKLIELINKTTSYHNLPILSW